MPKATPVNAARERIVDMVAGYRASKVLLVAAHYDIFTILDGGVRAPGAIAKAAGLDLRAVNILLDALAALGLIRKTAAGFANDPAYADLLVKKRPEYMGNNLKYQEMIWDAWSDLRDVVKHGRPERVLGQWLEQTSFSPDYILGMANIARRPAEEIAALFKPSEASALLDVGAGPGTYSLAFLRRHPFLTADLLDLPSTVAITSDFLAGDRLRPRLRFREGDYHRADFGTRQYDFVIMSHITHDEGEAENQALIAKAFRALRPGGHLIVHDFMTLGKRTTPAFPALFSVHMLVYTAKGQVYSVQQYESWLKEAGFIRPRRHAICKDTANASLALVASRPPR